MPIILAKISAWTVYTYVIWIYYIFKLWKIKIYQWRKDDIYGNQHICILRPPLYTIDLVNTQYTDRYLKFTCYFHMIYWTSSMSWFSFSKRRLSSWYFVFYQEETALNVCKTVLSIFWSTPIVLVHASVITTLHCWIFLLNSQINSCRSKHKWKMLFRG